MRVTPDSSHAGLAIEGRWRLAVKEKHHMSAVGKSDLRAEEIARLVREATQWLERLHSKEEVVLNFVAWLLASPQHVQSFLIIGQIYYICHEEAAGGDPNKLDQQKIVDLVKARIRAFPELFGSTLNAPSTYSVSGVLTLIRKAKGNIPS